MLKVFTFFLMISGLSFAQISITQQDIESAYGVGTTSISHSDSVMSSINIGATGATSWDFSNIGLVSHLSAGSEVVATSAAPELGRFPGTTKVFKSLATSGSAGDAHLYYMVSGSEFSHLGSWVIMSMGGISVVTYTRSFPKSVIMQLPMTYNTSWQTTSTDTMLSLMSGMVLNTDVYTETSSFVVDAYGPCKFPDGVTEDALRLRRTTTTTDQWGTTTEVEYTFHTKSGRSLDIDCLDSNPPNNGVVSVTEVTWQSTGTTDVNEEGVLPAQFQLQQNYPNPFNPSTVIQFSLPNSGHTTLKVFNILGVEVAELVNGFRSAGQYNSVFDAAGLSAGVYFARLQSGNHIQTIKMNLLK